MSTNDPEPEASVEQQADALRSYAAERGIEARPAPDARELLDQLLDGRPQLAALALNLLTAAVESGAVVTDSRPLSSLDIVSTLRRGRRSQMLAERAAMIERDFPAELGPMAHALAQLAETRKAGEKATESTPVMIRRAKAEGMKPADIARLLKVSDSHVYAMLRKEPDGTTTAVEKFLADMLGTFEEHERETRAARRRTAEAHGVEPDLDDEDQ
ncbi:hypothetical protein ACIQFU_28185 [Streptomyces sp. NPDC093065]|uniref:hypothetical protein n=1 Tax=Streptomyces sp. NPDC093065 TaxID=3366021 RepID=UPI0037F53402